MEEKPESFIDETTKKANTSAASSGSASTFLDWTTGSFPHVPLEKNPSWLRPLVHLVIFSVLLGVPIVLIVLILRGTDKWYDLTQPLDASQSSNVWMELVRWSLLVGSTYAAWGISQLILGLMIQYMEDKVVVVPKKASSQAGTSTSAAAAIIDRDEPPKLVGELVLGLQGLKEHIAGIVGVAVLMTAAFVLFPVADSQENSLGSLIRGALNHATPTAAAAASTSSSSSNQGSGIIKGIVGKPLPWLVTRFAVCAFVVSLALLVEKAILQSIARAFHKHSAAGRISDNNFQLKMVRRLRRALVDARRLEPKGLAEAADAKEAGELLFDAICPTGAERITLEDLRAFLPVGEEIERFWAHLDPETHRDLHRNEFALAIAHFAAERTDLSRTLTDQAKIIQKLDRLFLVLTAYAALTACLFVLGISMGTILATVGGPGVVFAFVFSSAARTAFESIVFVILTHPFDVGDRVLIKGEVYVVKELGLWSSTFYGPNRRITYITNSVLRNQMIVNVRRSPLQNEVIAIKILPGTPSDRLEALEARLNAFLKANARDYVPPITLKNYKFVDKEHMIVEMLLSHRSNFQNGDLKDARTKNFMLALKDAMVECGVDLAPSY